MILVTGANGMVGSYVKEIFADMELLLTDIADLDISDKNAVSGFIAEKEPEFVLHLAAETDVDRCEKEPEHAYKVNTEATENIALACRKSGSTMVYISTGYVFNGDLMQQHTEEDTPDPLSVYAKSKYRAELLVRRLLEKYYIFRADWMIGGGPGKDKKFVGKIIELCKTRKEIEAVNDISGSPTFGRDFVKGIKTVIETEEYGLYHLANKGVCTRYDVAVEIVKDMGFDVAVKPVSSDRFPLPAPRAKSSGLRNLRLEEMGLDIMPAWQDSLKQYLKEWKE
jgi:dTDP-4-dehydrorhamnose reductase